MSEFQRNQGLSLTCREWRDPPQKNYLILAILLILAMLVAAQALTGCFDGIGCDAFISSDLGLIILLILWSDEK